MRNRLIWTIGTGILAIVAYIALAIASYAYYPAPFNPRDNWLSDLGNSALNPSGAFLYRFDGVLVGVLLALFFVGLRPLARGQEKRVKIFLALAEAFGFIAGVALAMTGVFSEGQHASHWLWSAVLFVCVGTAVFFSGFAVLRHPGFSRRLSYLAFALTVIDWAMAAFHGTRFLEWVLVTLLLCSVGALSYRMMFIDKMFRSVRTGK
jgi:hypothetical membrane protein